MFTPSENVANAGIAAVTGVPAALLALHLSQTDVALIIGVANICLAVGFKAVDIYMRYYRGGGKKGDGEDK